MMDNPIDDILSNLDPDPDPKKYNGTDFTLAWDNLPKDVTMGIPWCVYQYLKTDDGEFIFEEQIDRQGNLVSEEKKPARRTRIDVLSVLAWVAVRKRKPDMTPEKIAAGITDENLYQIIRSTFAFWGVTLPTEEDLIEMVDMEGEEIGNPPDDQEMATQIETISESNENI
jgi:hypothetical protein